MIAIRRKTPIADAKRSSAATLNTLISRFLFRLRGHPLMLSTLTAHNTDYTEINCNIEHLSITINCRFFFICSLSVPFIESIRRSYSNPNRMYRSFLENKFRKNAYFTYRITNHSFQAARSSIDFSSGIPKETSVVMH